MISNMFANIYIYIYIYYTTCSPTCSLTCPNWARASLSDVGWLNMLVMISICETLSERHVSIL